MLFGGTDRKSDSTDVFLLEINEQKEDVAEDFNKEEMKENGVRFEYELKRFKTRLCEPDWFYNINTGIRDPSNPNQLLIMAERKTHVFDLKTMEFT